MKRFFAVFAAVVGVAVVAVGAGSAAPKQPQAFSCNGLGDIQLLTAPAYGADQSWGTAQIVGTGHLIPVSFEFSGYDTDANVLIFDSGPIVKGGGNANHNQQTTSCSQSQTGPLADFLEPGDQPPPGTDLSDMVTVTFSATAIVK